MLCIFALPVDVVVLPIWALLIEQRRIQLSNSNNSDEKFETFFISLENWYLFILDAYSLESQFNRISFDCVIA